MNAKEFKGLIKQLVQEELKKSLPVLIPQILSEMNLSTGGRDVIKENKHDDFFEELRREIDGAKSPVAPAAKPKEVKKYSNNPILNEVLNQTQGGVVPDMTDAVQVPQPSFKQGAYPLSITEPSPAPALNESTVAQAQHGVFKDYRKLMKAIEKKKSNGRQMSGFGPLSITGGIPTDFTQSEF